MHRIVLYVGRRRRRRWWFGGDSATTAKVIDDQSKMTRKAGTKNSNIPKHEKREVS